MLAPEDVDVTVDEVATKVAPVEPERGALAEITDHGPGLKTE